jgi:hypothetical protein
MIPEEFRKERGWLPRNTTNEEITNNSRRWLEWCEKYVCNGKNHVKKY